MEAAKVPTRYGRLGFHLQSVLAPGGGFTIRANITLPSAFADASTRPAGGLRLRLRAPPPNAGRMSAVTLGGTAWPHFDAAAETVDFVSTDALALLTQRRLVVATFTS